jgi:hypothetical protein
MHEKLWGKRDLFDQIFRSVNLTKTDFIELQNQLQNLHPSRRSESYVATNVLNVKADFLRSRSSVGMKCHPSSSANLIPQVVVDTSEDLNPFIEIAVMDDDSMDNDMDDDSMDSDKDDDMDVHTEPDLSDIPCGFEATACLTESDPPDVVVDASKDLTPPTDAGVVTTDVAGTSAVDYAMETIADSHPNSLPSIDSDAALLSEGPDAIFPCSIRYLDLTFLELKHLVRVPHLMLIRDEWRTVIDIFNNRERGIRGSAVWTGSPGIGRHSYSS